MNNNKKVNVLVSCKHCGNKMKFMGKYLGTKKCVFCGKSIKVNNLSILKHN